ncbi:uncharacterized protein LOC128219683 isoform X2 [Mya arenaria]|nr:uncharacterized protein LOC128219683 isoform X2 [Mya arenaria]
MSDSLKQIYRKAAKVYKKDRESYERFANLLLDSTDEGRESFVPGLMAVIDDDDLFKATANSFVSDAKRPENDKPYREAMQAMLNLQLRESDNKCLKQRDVSAVAVHEKHMSAIKENNFVNAVKHLPLDQYEAFQNHALTHVCKMQTVVQKARSCKQVTRVALAASVLAKDVLLNIQRWWKGEISGKRCVKNILDCGVTVAAGLVGGAIGEVLGGAVGGAVFGPVGAACGAIIGAVTAGATAANYSKTITDALTSSFFDLPKSEALENAYRFLDCSPSASNSTINSRYRKLALRFHPDKGGDRQKWTRLQYAIEIVREAREEK